MKKSYKTEKKKIAVSLYDKYDDIEERYATKIRELTLNIPPNFRMLCALNNVQAEKVLDDFMMGLSSSFLSEATSAQRDLAVQYFISCKYDRGRYTPDQVEIIFKELEAVRLLGMTMKKADHEDHRLYFWFAHMYAQNWFKKWFFINRNNKDLSVLDDY